MLLLELEYHLIVTAAVILNNVAITVFIKAIFIIVIVITIILIIIIIINIYVNL